jgi:hypothetical protein
MQMAKKVNEEALLKALDKLEKGVSSGEANPLPKKQAGANGGFSQESVGEGPTADVGIPDGSDDDDPTEGKSLGDDSDLEKAEDEESEGGEDEDTSEEEESSPEEETAKSLREGIEEDDVVKSAIEVSDFLERLVDQTVESVDGLHKSFSLLKKSQRDFNGDLRDAVVAIGNEVMRVSKSLDQITEALGNQPVGRARAQMSKSLQASAVQAGNQQLVQPRFDGDEGGEFEFSKSQALEALMTLAQTGKVHPIVVTEYETSGSLPQQVQDLVMQKLRSVG